MSKKIEVEVVALDQILGTLGDCKAFLDARDVAEAHEQLSAGPIASPLARVVDRDVQLLAEILGVGRGGEFPS